MARIAVVGAGSIGAYLGGALLGAGAETVMIGRQRMQAELAEHGLRLSDWRDWRLELPGHGLPYVTSPDALASAELILVCVKSRDTPAAAAAIRDHAREGVLVVSFQNGVRNAERLRQELPGAVVLAGMVPFNVLQLGQGRLHRGTEGELCCDEHPALASWRDVFARAGLPLDEHADMSAVLWGKLLLNLNNAVNALADVPLAEELARRGYRRVLGMLMAEGLEAVRGAGIRPVTGMRVPLAWLPRLFALPDWIFVPLARSMFEVGPEARSSMWEDLQRGRPTEIDELNGMIVELAERNGRKAPRNAKIVELIRAAEAGGRRAWPAGELYEVIRQAR